MAIIRGPIRKLKRNCRLVVQSKVLAKELTAEQGKTFEDMIGRSLDHSELDQVMEALRGFCTGWQTDKDAYGLLLQDDPLGLDP